MNFRWLLVWGILWCACTDKEVAHKGNNAFDFIPSAASGIDFSNDLTYLPDLNIVEYLYYYNGSGVSIGDINNDGLEDIYLGANQAPDRLYLNKGNLQFEDISASSGLTLDNSWTTGINMEDIDNDGDLDIYVCKLGDHNSAQSHNHLYINNGDLTFSERSKDFGLDFKGYSTQAVFLDYDKDDDLDLYIVNHNVHSIRSYGSTDKRLTKDTLAGDLFFENRLNEKEGKFVDVTEKVGIYSSALGYGLSVVSSDFNNDGWPDIYVGNDFHENDYLYLNTGKNAFSESIDSYASHTSKFTMGIDAKDINNDGYIDLFTSDMLPRDKEILMASAGEETDQLQSIKRDFGYHTQYARNHLQINKGGRHFVDMALAADVYASDWTWSALVQDFDNDAKQDIFITNGIVRRPNDLDYINYVNQVDFSNLNPQEQDLERNKMIEQMPEIKISNLMALGQNNSELSFKMEQLGHPSFSNGAAYADLDKDGDLDLVVNNINQAAFLMENKVEGQNYSSIQLIGNQNHLQTKGSRVILYSPDGKQIGDQQTTRGFLSSSTHLIFFGLGQTKVIDSIAVIWPDGMRQVLLSPDVNKELKIVRKEEGNQLVTLPQQTMKSNISVFQHKHSENEFEDYNNEILIPQKLSREGPGVLLEDFDKDGHMDMFIGGAHFHAPQLYMGSSSGKYNRKEIAHFRKDANYEDVDVASLDFNGDGHRDIYVVSGGGQYDVLNKNLEDRLYLNDGKGNFVRWPLSLPHTNGSSVAIYDYNGDGWDDIFVGGRSIPKAYGLSPYSYLLKNVNGQYVDIEFKSRLGMVTDSEWTDINQDSLPDLVIVGDWMPVTILMQKDTGGFINMSDEWRLGDTNGMWNTVSCVDINGDGKEDILAGNMGLNSKWSASNESPITLYLDDFDENGQVDPLIYMANEDEEFPFATADMLMKQIPQIRKKIPSYHSFARITSLEELTGKKVEDLLEVKQVKELRSMYYQNDGQAFEGFPLPNEMQASPVQDFELKNNEEQMEVLYVGNFKNNLALLGENSSNSGGVFSHFDDSIKAFTKHRTLGLPLGLNTREVLSISNNTYIITANNDFLYLLTL